MKGTMLRTRERYRMIAYLKGSARLDFNSTADQLIVVDSNIWQLDRILVFDSSVSLTTAAGGFYKSAAKASALTSTSQVYTASTGGDKYQSISISGVALTDLIRQNFLYLSLTTPQGAPAVAAVAVWARTFD